MAVAGLELLAATVIIIPAAGFSIYVLFVLLFIALFFVSAFGSWRGKRWG